MIEQSWSVTDHRQTMNQNWVKVILEKWFNYVYNNKVGNITLELETFQSVG